MMFLFLAIVVGVVVLVVRWLGGSQVSLFRPIGRTSHAALDILKERLARGEIDVAEFEERKRALGDVKEHPSMDAPPRTCSRRCGKVGEGRRRQEQAHGILIASLGMLAGHFWYGEARLAS